jgi:hypothetical protein
MASCCKKIVDYMVVRQSLREDFSETVGRLIREGWQPFGGVAVIRYVTAQAMVKYEECSN